MVKKKVVVNVPMHDQKSRTKALKIVAGLRGVESAGFKGEEKNQIEVIGEFDSVQLASLLRKKIGHADLVSVEDKKEEKKEEPPIVGPCGASVPYYYYSIPIYEPSSQYGPPLCSIL